MSFRRTRFSTGFLLVAISVLALAASCAAYLVRIAFGNWREAIWFSPITAAVPLLLLSAIAIVQTVRRIVMDRSIGTRFADKVLSEVVLPIRNRAPEAGLERNRDEAVPELRDPNSQLRPQ